VRRFVPTLLALISASLLASSVSPSAADSLPEFDASNTVRPSQAALARTEAAAARPGIRRLARVATTDERYGVPSFVWANRVTGAPPATLAVPRTRTDADRAARTHLSNLAPLYRLDRDDLQGVRLQRLHDTGRGAIVATYRQTIGGIEVFRDAFRVCLDRDLNLVSVSGSLPSRAGAPADAQAAFTLPAAGAVARALQDFGGLSAPPVTPVSRGSLPGG